MNFSWKVFFCTVILIAATFSAGCYMLVSSVFDTGLERETTLCLEENQMLRFSYETSVASVPLGAGKLSDSIIQTIGESLESGSLSGNRIIRISDENYNSLYKSKNMNFDNSILEQIEKDERVYKIFTDNNMYFIQSACIVNQGGRKVYIDSVRNITRLFEERTNHYNFYRYLTICILFISSTLMCFVSLWLTRPIKILSATTRRIAGGEYEHRAKITSKDEIGQLAIDFNSMADTLQAKIAALEETARQKEDFTSSFAHELKTPLTSIIGYADMLRSRAMTPDKQFIAANYIFNEGRRLEALSLKLMDLFVLKKQKFIMKSINPKELIQNIAGVMKPLMTERKMTLNAFGDNATINGEPDLLKTLLINLIDNARKASPDGATIELLGKNEENSTYTFYVIDSGQGIPPEEITKITEAFYMVDKSRSRAQNGAGLGLAICDEIAKIHNTVIEFESIPNKGTTVKIRIGGNINEI